MRRFVTFGPALVVLLTMVVTLVAAPAAVRMVRAADAAARAAAARDALAADDILARLSNATANVGEAVMPSVVHLDVRTAEGDGSLGSAWVYDERGFIVTNAHVVAAASTITAQFSDGRLYDAALVGVDAGTDIAVLKIDPLETLVPLPRSPDPLRPGERVYSFGSPFNFKFSMSEGIVSGLGRESMNYSSLGGFSNFIQFDAAVNPGNSGGPLVDVMGRAVGMNVAIANNTNTLGASDQGQSAGISFAIPVRVVEFVAGQLIENGEISRGFLGINLPRRDDLVFNQQQGYRGRGMYVPAVVADGPAGRAGLQRGDFITAIDGQEITGTEMLRSIISTMEPGHDALLEVWRDGTEMTVTVEVAEFERPALVRQQIATTLQSLGARLAGDGAPDAPPRFDLVVPGLPAYNAGLMSDMTVLTVNGSPVRTIQELCERLDTAGLRLRTPVRLGVDVATEDGGTRRREIVLRVPG